MRIGGRRVRLLCALVTLATATVGYAGPIYQFECITNNNAADAAIGEAQLFMEVLPGLGSTVEFNFTNIGPEASSITDIYFDDELLLQGIANIINGPGVSFAVPASPPGLPGGASITPPFVATFSADSVSPTASNGVNPGEFVRIVADLQPGKTYADVLSDIGAETLRVGLHVQAFDGGGSESFVNIPAPGAILLGALGIAGIGWLRQRRILG